MPCGNTVAMVGLDQFITKNATLTNEKADDAFPIKAMKFSVSPVVSSLLLLAFQPLRFMDKEQAVAAVRPRTGSDLSIILASMYFSPDYNNHVTNEVLLLRAVCIMTVSLSRAVCIMTQSQCVQCHCDCQALFCCSLLLASVSSCLLSACYTATGNTQVRASA